MAEFLDKLNYWLQQAWVFIPIILSFITAVGLPSLVQIAKIFASAKLYLTQTKKILKKVNECVETIEKLNNLLKDFVDSEIAYNERMSEITYNKKQKQLLAEHKEFLLEFKTKSANVSLEVLPQEELQKKKVKVKVVKKEN